MKKTDVLICDECRITIAIIKCDLCENDLCHDCNHEVPINLNDNSFNHLNLCSTCTSKVDSILYQERENSLKVYFDEDDETKNKFVAVLKKLIILNNLKDKEKK